MGNATASLWQKIAIWLAVAAIIIGGEECAHKPSNPKAEALRSTALFYVGTPYRYGGESKKGMDCSGLVVVVYHEAGIRLPHKVEDQYEMGSKIPKTEIDKGDVVFFNTEPFAGASPCVSPCIMLGFSVPMVYGKTHNGIYIGDNKFVHASISRGVVVDRMDDEYWSDRYITARRSQE